MKKIAILTLVSATTLFASIGTANAGSNWSFGLFLPPAAPVYIPPPPRPVYVVQPTPVAYSYPVYDYGYNYWYNDKPRYKKCNKHKHHERGWERWHDHDDD